MPPHSLPGLPKDYTSIFFQGDVVTKKVNPSYRGKVMRGWADEEVLPEAPNGVYMPLVRGEVVVSDVMTGDLKVMSEMDLELFERPFVKGDFVKHSLMDAESALVIDVQTECMIEHVISGERISQWVPWDKLRNAVRIEAKDKVVYDEWLGTVEEVFEDGLMEAQDGTSYRMAEMGGILETGRYASEVVPQDPEFLALCPPGANFHEDRVIRVLPLIVYVVWNAINQTLPISEHDKHPEPEKFWGAGDISKLTHFETTRHQSPLLNTTVTFRDPFVEAAFGGLATFHLRNTFPLRVYKVLQNRHKLTLRWQDGTETEEFSSGFVPYRNVDDYEAWPGEALVWRSDTGVRRPAVVQTYNPKQRIAEVLLLDTKEKETVSVLELDTGGFGRVNYGVALGQFVLLCEDNGAELPEVPSLGQVEPAEDGRQGFKTILASLGVTLRGGPGQLSGYLPTLPQGDPNSITWWGEVVDMHLDGTISVELYSGERKRVDLKQIIVLNEPEAQFPPEFDDEYSDYTDVMSDRSWETVGDDGVYEDDGAPNGATAPFFVPAPDDFVHSDDDEDMDVDGTDGNSSVDREAVDVGMDDEASDDEVSDNEATPAPPEPAATPRAAESENQPTAGPSSAVPVPRREILTDSDNWVRFEVLESAPAEHHYFEEPLLPPASKTFFSRLRKEHRTLSTSLPENILVRTYEDRTDLMRVLIMGPEGTPYADAPFIFDVYLNPTKFPNEPPQVFFHSHTNGLGRCNPNLYEEGKVCLSVLGTWAGDKSESWSPTKSSLLQVFVSISGLVLVRSPYHCEPAFAKLEGTREGRVNSRLYSEKAYVLSRSFVRTALERPPAGFEAELTHAFFTKGRLASVIDHAQRLIAQGEVGDDNEDEMEEMWNADAIGRLSMGAILTLKRTVTALERIQARGPLPLPEAS
ncbi:hypothetical protein CC85DRAFT_267536 [Cutaneotrichosporon oleaginosum]|uniref:UBC core domain-containing protein n=1 Tax=Cutaneotrichosporon oleaginosum TaxID=879819 RepID=A0A0J0XZ94_9TREE|nr:uncharacterized protein CC85DRAFT_267536 [Cutaneotrichosporon oleaginosum]KLT46385.1 hypothetical protein CC85DRAFT_267536 [Cutaneotrichosporon oleaginosum]TXT15245.1 hypothetical protein COLE_01438 [Cutaneotrichosporon oleaginosum]